MELTDLLQALKHHNDKKGGYQIHLNSGNLEDVSKSNKDIEFGDLYFTDCHTLKNTVLLCFGNDSRNPIETKPDGSNIYPSEINNSLYIDMNKIESIEDIENFDDWFAFPSNRVINIYMFPQNDDMAGNRNVLTIGFME